MDYHSSLQPLFDFIKNLTFEEKDRKIHFVRTCPEQDTILIHEGEFYNSCNGLHLDDFNKRIKEIVREIEDDIDRKLISNGSEFKKEIRQVVKSLNRLKQDFFNDSGLYIGKTTHISDKLEIMELKINGTYIHFLCDKYKCEDYMISDTRENSKQSEFFKSLYYRFIGLGFI